jgi:SWI/SNF-related matrix-associated actin-dependent regulator 1 of chromatin subfamily A
MPELYEFQDAAVAALEGGATLLAAQPGAGKTATAIEFARRTLAQANTVLAACPAIAVGVWLAEVAKWWPQARAVLLRDLVTGATTLPPGPTFVVSSYDYLVVNQRAREVVAAAQFDLGICDESHALKSPEAKRTRLLYGPRCAGDGLLSRCTRVILLTGTPTPNGLPSELWPALRCFVPDLIGGLDYDPFVRTYCTFKLRQVQTRYGIKTIEQIAGASARAPELARAIAPFWYRPPREVVERGLPPLRMVTRRLPSEMLDAKALKAAEKSPEAAQLREAIADGDLRGVEGHLSRLRRLLALTKVKAAVAWIEDVLEQGEPKVIAWGWHTEPLEQLRAGLTTHKPLLVDGSTPQRERDAAVAAFQSDPNRRVFIGQIAAAGQAVTLTAARRAVFLEQAWTPSANWQALKRAHRIGQQWPVLGEALCAPGLDEAVQNLLVRKSRDIRTLEAAA